MANNPDMITYLPDTILILIISFLPFKEAARTCILSKRWCKIWRATKNIEFNETFFVKNGESTENEEVQRRNFVDFMRQFIVHYNKPVVDQFRLKFSDPMNFREDMEQSVTFAVAREVKALALDFSDPKWDQEEEDDHHHAAMFDLPSQVYGHKVLESLELILCNFQVLETVNFTALKSLSLGWIELTSSSIKTLLLNCQLLENLSLKKCWNIDFLDISVPNLCLQSLVIDKCSLNENAMINIATPKLRFLKYSGKVISFNIEEPHHMQEADIDFGQEFEFSELGDVLCELLQQIYCIKVLTVCSYMLQVLPTGEEPLGLSSPLRVRHLILKTAMHENEFYGISFLLKSCPYLDTLSIEIGPAQIYEDYEPPFGFETQRFWTRNVLVFKCITKTLKVVEIKGFKGTPNELQLLKYLLSFGRVMEMLTINISREMDSNGGNIGSYQKNAQKVQQFKKASRFLQINVK